MEFTAGHVPIKSIEIDSEHFNPDNGNPRSTTVLSPGVLSTPHKDYRESIQHCDLATIHLELSSLQNKRSTLDRALTARCSLKTTAF